MRSDQDAFLDEGPPRGLAVEKVRDLSLGAKIMLASLVLLFFSMFLTWQHLEIDYGRTGTGTQMLDGWDAIGLVIGLLSLGLLTFVVVVKLYDPELAPEGAELWALVLAIAIFALVVAKNLTDQASAWASYVAVTLAAAVVIGAFLDWARDRLDRRAVPGRRRRGFS
jgi:cellobiose-specific phosphotransferase system component IIC